MAPAICRNEDPTATTLWLIPGRHKATAALTRPAALQVQKEALAAKIQALAAAEHLRVGRCSSPEGIAEGTCGQAPLT